MNTILEALHQLNNNNIDEGYANKFKHQQAIKAGQRAHSAELFQKPGNPRRVDWEYGRDDIINVYSTLVKHCSGTVWNTRKKCAEFE